MNKNLFERYEESFMRRSSNEIVVRNVSSGPSFCGLLFLLFLGLKLTHYIDWSWWWVTSPLWMPVMIVASIAAIAFTCVALYVGILYAIIWFSYLYDRFTKENRSETRV